MYLSVLPSVSPMRRCTLFISGACPGLSEVSQGLSEASQGLSEARSKRESCLWKSENRLSPFSRFMYYLGKKFIDTPEYQLFFIMSLSYFFKLMIDFLDEIKICDERYYTKIC